MIEEIRAQILSVDGIADENIEDYELEEKQEQEVGNYYIIATFLCRFYT